jgi:HD-GYP domain-containing protein (c-di-GMP phosphodiesterase class II)
MPRPTNKTPRARLKTTGQVLLIQARQQHPPEETLQQAMEPALVRTAWQSKHLEMLLRICSSLPSFGPLDDMLRTVLESVVQVLDAQRGAIVLSDEQTGELRARAVTLAGRGLRDKAAFSHTLARLVLDKGESVLCGNVRNHETFRKAASVTHGQMASILCVLLRTPRNRLGVLHLDRGPYTDPFRLEDFHLASAIAAVVSNGIENAQLVEREREQFVQTLTALGRAVEVRDEYTANHTSRVTQYALLLAQQLRLSAQDYARLQIGTPLHDIGKIGIDDAILRKPGKLTTEEFETMKLHTLKGAAILETVPALHGLIPIARHHHERWDGGGYPDHLAGDRIELVARIVAVADAFDAMTSDRPYRRGLSVAHAYAELLGGAGKQFDPACVAAFLDVRRRVESICQQRPGVTP